MRRVDTERFTAGGLPTARVPRRGSAGGDRRGNARDDVRAAPQPGAPAGPRTNRRASGVFELIEPGDDPDTRGLGILPEPSPWDVFFDIEADPWAGDDGLEYLFGIVTVDTGEPVYRPIWGTDPDGERAALATFLELVIPRLDAHPDMHVFHYGGYESGALKRLVGRHGFGTDDLDRLLRGDVLVDLLNVVRQGVRASVESYSLKQIEKFYLPVREGPVTDAGFSVVEFERWLRDRDETILDGIAAYNRDDCVSTWMLRDWLEDRGGPRRCSLARSRLDPPGAGPGNPTERVGDWIKTVAHRTAALTAGLDPLDDGDGARSRRLLAGSARLASARGEVPVVALVRADRRRCPWTSSSMRATRSPASSSSRRSGSRRRASSSGTGSSRRTIRSARATRPTTPATASSPARWSRSMTSPARST